MYYLYYIVLRQRLRFVCSHSTIVQYILFILSCTTCQFRFVCSLFLLFFCSDTNNPCPCSTDAIGARHRLPPPTSPQEPMVELPFRRFLLTLVPPYHPRLTPVSSGISIPSSQQQDNFQFLQANPRPIPIQSR